LSQDTLIAIGSLMFFMAVGFVLRKCRKMPDSWMAGLNSTVLIVALPAMIIVAFQEDYSPELGGMLLRMLGWSALCQGAMIGLGWLATLRAGADKKAILRFTTGFSNAGFIGFPVVAAAFAADKNQALLYATMFVAMFHVFAWTLGRSMFDKSSKSLVGGLRSLLNPTIAAIIIGLVFFYTRVQLPRAIRVPLEGLSGLTTPLSLIVIGARLGTIRPRELTSSWAVPAAVVLRQFAAPAIAFAVLWIGGLRGLPMQVLVLESAMPVAVFLSMFAERWEGNKALAAQVVALSTLTACLTIPLWLWIVQR